jgi:hypothetical protein
MRTDDPAMLKQIEQLEYVAESLRRICGFPPLRELPETTASRRMRFDCPHCSRICRTQDDLDAHTRTDHTPFAARETS